MIGEKLEYSINNFSGLINVSEYTEKAPKSKQKGLYFFYSRKKELLYIGKSISCIRGRLCNHLITDQPDRYNDDYNSFMLKKRKSYLYFAYSIIDKNFVESMEIFLIKKYRPKFNIEFNK